jgi:hypothetical protein
MRLSTFKIIWSAAIAVIMLLSAALGDQNITLLLLICAWFIPFSAVDKLNPICDKG